MINIRGEEKSYQVHNSQYEQSDAYCREIENMENYEKINQFARLGFETISKKASTKVDTHIDIGSGVGWLLKKTAPLFKQVIGVEPSEAAINLSKQLIKNLNNISFVNSGMTDFFEKTDIKKPVYITSSTVFSHISDKVMADFLNIINNLPNGSILYFGEPYDKNRQQYLWYVRNKEWWAKYLRNWNLVFNDINPDGQYKYGISGECVGVKNVKNYYTLSFIEKIYWYVTGIPSKIKYLIKLIYLHFQTNINNKIAKKIKIAFIKTSGLTSGGTEKFLQTVAINLPKDKFEVDYYYSEPVSFKNPNLTPTSFTDYNKIKLMKDNGVNLIKFNLDYVDLGTYTHDWINTDFWTKFSENKYDIIQTGRAGNPEYPFYKIKKTPIIDSLHLSGMVDNQYNISRVMHICQWNADKWIDNGGDKERIVIISHPMDIKFNGGDLKKEYNIGSKFVFGFHQRNEDSIFSDIPLRAYQKVESENNTFIILGGSNKYREQARELGIKNIIFINHNSDIQFVYRFLNTLNVYAHGREDGEVNSTAMAEALYFGCPIISHFSEINNGHVECIGNAGRVFSNVEDYAQELKKIQGDRSYYTHLSEEAKKRFTEKYELNDQMDNIINIYKEVLKNPFPRKIRRIYYHFINFILKRLLINKYSYLFLKRVRDYLKK